MKGVETMFKIEGTTFHITRGDIASFDVNMKDDNGTLVNFDAGDVVRFRVVEKKHYDETVLKADVIVPEECETVSICLDSDQTRIGGTINKAVEYWYEIEKNPDTAPQTILGDDKNGPKLFILYPEGVDTV